MSGEMTNDQLDMDARVEASHLRPSESSVFDELRGMVIDLEVGTFLPRWVTKDAVIRGIDRVEAERDARGWGRDCPTCVAEGHEVPPPPDFGQQWMSNRRTVLNDYEPPPPPKERD